MEVGEAFGLAGALCFRKEWLLEETDGGLSTL